MDLEQLLFYQLFYIIFCIDGTMLLFHTMEDFFFIMGIKEFHFFL